MQQDKIKAALTTALRHMEESISAYAHNDEKAVSNSLWIASSETEYAVFLLSLLQSDNSKTTPSKQGSSTKQSMELQSSLISAQQLLASAKADVQAGDYKKGYEEAWIARNLLLKVQDFVEKKRKEGGKK